MIKLWVLTIYMIHGSVTQGKLLSKENCEKLGKQIVGNSRSMKYSCKPKKFKMK